MSTKKIKTVQEVKELLNDYVEPVFIGRKGCANMELDPQNALYKVDNLIRVSKMALMGITEIWGHINVNELPKKSNADLHDVIYTLEIATQLLPTAEMELIARLQEEL